jgi:hypothetical protein
MNEHGMKAWGLPLSVQQRRTLQIVQNISTPSSDINIGSPMFCDMI